jgi:hypothetical protein
MTKDNILANNMIKKTTLIFLLCSILYGCSPHKSEQSLTTPFQCLKTQTRCEVITEFGAFLIKFNVDKVLTEYPFTIQVSRVKKEGTTENSNNETQLNVLGYMEGKTMFMGKIPLFFKISEDYKEGNSFIAETMLGSCSEDVMTWRLWITLVNQEKTEKNQQMTFFIDFDSMRF